jgi:hypothetical protein
MEKGSNINNNNPKNHPANPAAIAAFKTIRPRTAYLTACPTEDGSLLLFAFSIGGTIRPSNKNKKIKLCHRVNASNMPNESTIMVVNK